MAFNQSIPAPVAAGVQPVAADHDLAIAGGGGVELAHPNTLTKHNGQDQDCLYDKEGIFESKKVNIMIDIKLKYQASIFSEIKDIIPTPSVITTLIEQFKSHELIPQTFQEIELPGTVGRTRLRFASQNDEWNIQFGRRRINIESCRLT